MPPNGLFPLAVIFVGNTHTFYAALSALEKEKIDTKDTLLLINSKQLCEDIIHQKTWFDVKFIGITKKEKAINKFKNQFLHIIWGLKSKAILNRLNTQNIVCFIAAHYNWIPHVSSFHLIKNKNKKFIVIDDGMKNIILEKLREDELSQKKPNILYMGGYKNKYLIEKLLYKIICKLTGLKIESIPILYWYTKLPTAAFSKKTKDKIIDISEKPNSSKSNVKVAHFISQPLLNLGNVDINLLAQLFKSIRENIDKSIKIIYIPHRVEETRQKTLANQYFTISSDINEPYENYFIKLKTKPGIIISFYSSVLFTLHRESENNIKFYAIDSPNIDFTQERNYRHLYKAINNSKYITLINININT